MFGSLFLKECKQIRKSTVYYIFLACFIFFMTTQLGRTSIITKPVPGEENYGQKTSENPDIIMSQTLEEYWFQLQNKTFPTYPYGFIKNVYPSPEEYKQLTSIMEECTGQTMKEIKEAQQEEEYKIQPRQDMSYEEFKNKMVEVTKIIGKGSSFEQKEYESNAVEPMTYEDAMQEYEELCNVDGITDAFMRLFCDYAAIVLSLLPVFLGVTRCSRDRRAKAALVINSKPISSTKIVMSRYLSNLVMILLPVLILAIVMQSPYIFQADSLGVRPHFLSCISYPVIWLLPEIMIVLALSFLVTELFRGVAAIAVQVVWALFCLFTSTSIVGEFGLQLAPRWNTFGETMLFQAQRTELYLNRLFYFGVSLVLLVITIICYDWKRKGGKSGYGKKHEIN